MKKLAAIVLLLLCLLYWYLHPIKSTNLPEKSDESLSQAEEISKIQEIDETEPQETDGLIYREEDLEPVVLEETEEFSSETESQEIDQSRAVDEETYITEAELEEWDEAAEIVREKGLEKHAEEAEEHSCESEAISELEEVVLSEVVPEAQLDETEQYITEAESLGLSGEAREEEVEPETVETVAQVEELEPEVVEAVAREEEVEPETVEAVAQVEELEPEVVEPVAQVEELEPEVVEPVAQVEELEPEVVEPVAQVEELEPEVVEPVAQVEELEPETVEAVAQVEELEPEVVEAVAQVEELEPEVVEAVAQVEELEPEVVEPVAQVEELEPETVEAVAQVEELEPEVVEAVAQVEELEPEVVEAVAQVEELKPEKPPLEILENLRGILFLGDWNLTRKEPVDCVEGIASMEVGLLDAHPEFKRELQRKFIGKPLTDQTIEQIKEIVADFYASHHQPFVVISIPKQEVTQEVLQVVVDEARIGEIRCKGNQHFTNQDLLHYLRVKPGESVIAKTIVQDVAFMNQNPFRHTDILFTPGAKSGTTDLELITVDRWPYRIYAGADNTGTISTQRNRIFFGFNFGKTIIRDSEMSFQYTASPNVNRFYAYTGLFRIPCPWRHTLQGYGGYTKVHPNTETHKLYQRGVSWQVDLRYRIPLFETPDLSQELVLGYDFKETNNDILFGGENIFHGDADINQLMVGYELGSRDRRRKVTFQAEIYGNPGGMTTHNKNSSYEKLRYEALSRYVYLRVNHSLMQESITGFFLSYNFSMQIASTNLLPSEQLTMTGYNAVRGFEERILNLDNAALLNLTMELPHFSPAHLMGCKRYDDFYIHIFADAGLGRNHKQMPGEHRFYSLGSVGPGARYQFGRYCSARFDYGVQLWHQNFNPVTHSRYNFGLVLSY